MKNILIAAALAASVALSGCATTGGGGQASMEDIVQQVRAAVIQSCKFVADTADIAQVVAALIPTYGQAVGAASAMAQAICAGASPPTASRAGQYTAKRVQTPKGFVLVRGKYQ
jgi:predicted small secreted protein